MGERIAPILMIKVELLAARIPGLPGIVADHHWFLIHCDLKEHKHHSCDRWEVWQHPFQNTALHHDGPDRQHEKTQVHSHQWAAHRCS